MNQDTFVSPLSALQVRHGYTMKRAKYIKNAKGEDIKDLFVHKMKSQFWGETFPKELLVHGVVQTLLFPIGYAVCVWLAGLDAILFTKVWVIISFLNARFVVRDAWGIALFKIMIELAPEGISISQEQEEHK